MFLVRNHLLHVPVLLQAEDDMAVAEKYLNKTLYKLCIEALTIVPMLLALCAILNTLFDFFGIDSGFLSLLGGISIIPLAFLYIVSYVFRFCAYHRMFLHYILVSNLITWIDYYIHIPISTMTLFALHMFLIGLFLFLILYYYRKERCCR